MSQLRARASEDELIEALLLYAYYDEVQAGRAAQARVDAKAWLDRVVADGLPAPTDDGARRFDFVHTLNTLRERALSGADAEWNERVVATKRRHAHAFSHSTPAATLSEPRRISVKYRREIVMREKKPGSPVMVNLPLPREEPSQRDIVVEPVDQPGARYKREETALVLRGPVPADGVVKIETVISFTSRRITHALGTRPIVPADATDPAVLPHLASSEGLLQITPAIADLAASLRRSDPLATVGAIWDFFFHRMLGGAVYYDELGTDDPLGAAVRGRWADCLVGCTLFAALCRASGIPARLVHGFLLWPTDKGPHYWLEVLLPPHGWVPFDLHAWHIAGGDETSAAWSRSTFGRLPHQLALFRLPRTERELGLRFPPTWYQTAGLERDRATRLAIHDAATGALVYSDHFEVLGAEPVEDGGDGFE